MDRENSKHLTDKRIVTYGLIVLLLFVGVPSVYSAVEPHIKVTMDVAQTTKPIQVVDDQDVEVFSVDVDGTIFPAPVIASNIQEFPVSGYPEITIREDRSRLAMNIMTISMHVDGEISLDTTGHTNGNYADQVHFAQWRVDFAMYDECPTCNGNADPRSAQIEGQTNWETYTKNDDSITDADGATLWSWTDDLPTKVVWDIFGGDNDLNYESDTISPDPPEEFSICDIGRGITTGASDSCYIDLSWGVGGGDNGGTIFMKDSFWIYEFSLPQGATITKVS